MTRPFALSRRAEDSIIITGQPAPSALDLAGEPFTPGVLKRALSRLSETEQRLLQAEVNKLMDLMRGRQFGETMAYELLAAVGRWQRAGQPRSRRD